MASFKFHGSPQIQCMGCSELDCQRGKFNLLWSDTLSSLQCSTEFMPSSTDAFLQNNLTLKSVHLFQPTGLWCFFQTTTNERTEAKICTEFKCNNACCPLNSCMHQHVIYRTNSIPFQRLKLWKSLCHLLANL